jgi:hypothetical protein
VSVNWVSLPSSMESIDFSSPVLIYFLASERSIENFAAVAPLASAVFKVWV